MGSQIIRCLWNVTVSHLTSTAVKMRPNYFHINATMEANGHNIPTCLLDAWWGRQTGPEKHNISNKKFTRGSDKLPLTIAADQGKNLISMTVKFLRLWPWRMVCQLIFIIRRFCERNWNCIRNAFEGVETIFPTPFWDLLHSQNTS